MSTDLPMDYTLLGDSFDRLLEPRPALRALNIIKKNVDVSFNIDSSVENQESLAEGNSALGVTVSSQQLRNRIKDNHISTPMRDYLKPMPFQCSISPIRTWKFQHFTESELNLPNNELSDGNDFILLKNMDKLPQTLTKKPSLRNETKTSERLKNVNNNKGLAPIENPKRQVRPSRVKFANTMEEPIIINQSVSSFEFKKSDESHNTSEQIKKSFIRRISKCRKSVSNLKATSDVNHYLRKRNCHRDLVFNRCTPHELLSFDLLFNWNRLTTCVKIGEGAYGEVFMISKSKIQSTTDKTVLKIIPIEGQLKINGETQKTFEQILPEIVTAMELKSLRCTKSNATDRFVNVKKVSCVHGLYPKRLIEMWTQYDEIEGSENDNPEIFKNEQQYIALQLEFGGKDMESFIFNNAQQAYFALQQVVLALAVAEQAFEFEHRDLHLGNILISPTNAKNIKYIINGNSRSVPSGGVNITIIDYTLSRMTFDNRCFYNDLSTDVDLFKATGDYQYEVYRQMYNIFQEDWRKYDPKTNILWLIYVIKKTLNGVHYKSKETRIHKEYILKLQELEKTVLDFKSALEFANYLQNL